MSQLKIKLFDSRIVVIFLFFLPFTQALTFNVGFPLKISELALFVLIFLIIWYKKQLLILESLKNYGAYLLIFSLFSILINFLWQYDYTLNTNYISRVGFIVDSLLKWFYFLLAVITLVISKKVFETDKLKYINYFLYGSIIATLYSWHLFLWSLFGLSPILLFGMADEPQRMGLVVANFIRCGTFKEGNFMAFFLFISLVLSMYTNKKYLPLFFSLSIITTASTIGTIVTLLFWTMYLLKNSLKKMKYFILTVFFFSSISLGIVTLFENKDFNMLVISKLNLSDNEISDNGAFSREDRKNTLINAINMGLDNPILGIGLSNFALHYRYYNESRGVGFELYNLKVIQNNVYAEIFSELGFIGFLMFIIFLYTLYRKTSHDKSHILRFGFIGSLVYFFAFPSFTVLFIWVFFGLISSLKEGNLYE